MTRRPGGGWRPAVTWGRRWPPGRSGSRPRCGRPGRCGRSRGCPVGCGRRPGTACWPRWRRGRRTGGRSGWSGPGTTWARWPGRCWPPGWSPGWGSGRRCCWRWCRGCSRRRRSWSQPGRPGAPSPPVVVVVVAGAGWIWPRAGLGRALLPIVPFELGNVATTLLILPATQLLTGGGRSVQAAASLAILIYAGHNVVAARASVLGGRWVDRSGPRIGLAETAESALVARLLPDRLRGSGFGVLGGVQSAGDLLASALVGILYAAVSPAAGFGYAAGWMALSVTASAATRPAAAAR